MDKDLLKDIALALLGVVLTILFEMVSLRVTEPDTFETIAMTPTTQQEVEKQKETEAEVVGTLLGVHFDLWLVSLSLILGARFNRGGSGQSGQTGLKSTELTVMMFVGFLLLILALQVFSSMAPGWKTTFSLTLPNIVGLLALGLAVAIVRPAGKQDESPAGDVAAGVAPTGGQP